MLIDELPSTFLNSVLVTTEAEVDGIISLTGGIPVDVGLASCKPSPLSSLSVGSDPECDKLLLSIFPSNENKM